MDRWIRGRSERIILQDKAACVVAYQKEILYLDRARESSINGIFRAGRAASQRNRHFDKVIGKAAATFVEPETEIMLVKMISEAGYDLLRRNGIRTNLRQRCQ